MTSSGITSSTAQISWTAASPAPTQYDVYFSTSNTTPTAATIPVGSLTGVAANIIDLTAGTTYYFWVRSNCGSSNSAWVYGGSFTTIAQGACIDALYGQYPEQQFTPNCTGSFQTIVTDAYAGEFSFVDVYPNRTYTFSSSVATDFITIGDGNQTMVYTSGITPVVWDSGSITDVVRFYLHTNSSCGSQNINRIKSVKCSNTLEVEDNQMESLLLFPNPTTNLLHITFNTTIDSVFVYNMLGQLVAEQNIQAKTGIINLSEVSAGTYFVKVLSGENLKTLKVIKE